VSPTTSRAFKSAAYAHLADVGKALASPARLEILELLAQAPRSVEALAGEIDQSVANTSHHLQALRRARLVTAARDGLRVVYALSGDDVARLLVHLHGVAARHVADVDRLTRAYLDDPGGVEAIDRDTLIDRLRAGQVTLIDVRPEREYVAGHVPGALSMPLDTVEARVGELPRDRAIVAYCRGPFCTFSAEAARKLRALGFDARRTDLSVHSFSGARR
jgi:rhodanese-related sulfurtransferase/DNA-binding transcriptional ArsR family regulator